MADMVKSGVISLPEEDVAVSYIDVRDVAACIAALLKDNTEHIEKYYAITGPEGVSAKDVAAKISAATGKEIVFKAVPEEVHVAQLEKMGLPSWNINMLVSLCRVVNLGMMGNATKAVEFLTGTPARTFDEFAAEHADVWK